MNRRFLKAHGSEVSAGPFKGMLYESHPAGDGTLVQKLLGAYEQELHQHVELLIASKPSTIVNIGCHRGYYAVGFAMRLPDVQVIASDTSPSARDDCRRIAETNGVGRRVRTVGPMSVQEIQTSCGPQSLVVIDCEGCEFELLRPDQAPALRGTSIIAECHDFYHPGLTEELVRRFKETHSVSVIETAGRKPEDYRQLEVFAEDRRESAISEERSEDTRWAVMVPLRAGVSAE